MTKQTVMILLAPAAFFLLAAIVVLLMSSMLFKHASIDASHLKNFAAFAAGVHSGKTRLTVGQWLDTAKRQDEMVENFRQANITTGKILRLVGWAILAGIIFQIICLLFVANSQKKIL